MRTRSLVLLFTGVSATLMSGQSKLAPDIDPTSFSRLAPLDRAALDDDGKKVWDYIANGRALPATGPAQVSMHSPGAAKPIHELNQYLRKTVVGPRYFGTWVAINPYEAAFGFALSLMVTAPMLAAAVDWLIRTRTAARSPVVPTTPAPV